MAVYVCLQCERNSYWSYFVVVVVVVVVGGGGGGGHGNGDGDDNYDIINRRNKRLYDGRGMLQSWERREIPRGFWLEFLKERDCREDLGSWEDNIKVHGNDTG
jgi:hypothetical protein